MKIIALLLFMLVGHVEAKTFDKKLFEDTVKIIKKESYYELTDNEIYQAALAGVLRHLENKNKDRQNDILPIEHANVILPPRDLNEMKEEMEGEISGIGVGIEFDKGKGQVYPIINDVIKGGGAAKVGLKVGDQILKIDDVSVSKFETFKDIVYKIRGKTGSKLELSLLRNGDVFTKKIIRDKISWDAVEIEEQNKEFSVVKLNFFNKKTVPTLEKELTQMKKRGAKSLILDLRGNTGGLFEEGLKAIKLFASKGETVLLAKYHNGKVKEYKAETDGIGKDLKIVILINKVTKSMGEAFTSSMRGLSHATVIGERSYGKGTMETVVGLENDHSIKFTVGRLFTSDDKTWDKIGVSPDIEVSDVEKETKKDPQVELAKLLLAKG